MAETLTLRDLASAVRCGTAPDQDAGLLRVDREARVVIGVASVAG